LREGVGGGVVAVQQRRDKRVLQHPPTLTLARTSRPAATDRGAGEGVLFVEMHAIAAGNLRSNELELDNQIMRAEMTIESPLGPITIGEENGAIVSLRIERTADKVPANTRAGRDKEAAAASDAPPRDATPRAVEEAPTPLLAAAAAQLDAYFYCGLRNFDLKLAPKGSDFEHAIWDLMNAIPFGETRSYGELARAASAAAKREGLDAATVAQAVGQACGRNPIAIIQPCHRVMGAGGKLGGFSAPGGTETKLALLRHEGSVLL